MRRASDRGVAMTEAVIALPVLLLLFFATYWFHGAYRARLGALRAAQTAAFAAANADDCHARGEERRLGEVRLDPEAEGLAPRGARARTSTYGRIAVEAERAHAAPAILGSARDTRDRAERDASSGQARVRTRARVVLACNERDEPGLRSLFTGVLGVVLAP